MSTDTTKNTTDEELRRLHSEAVMGGAEVATAGLRFIAYGNPNIDDLQLRMGLGVELASNALTLCADAPDSLWCWIVGAELLNGPDDELLELLTASVDELESRWSA